MFAYVQYRRLGNARVVREMFPIFWPPISGVVMFVVSFLARIISKVIADFTSIVQLRHPNEVGGAYWTFR